MIELNLAKTNSGFSNKDITICNKILEILNLPANTTNISIREEKNGAYELKIKTEVEYKTYTPTVYKRISHSWYDSVNGEFYKREIITTYYLNGEKIELPPNLKNLIKNDISFNVYYL